YCYICVDIQIPYESMTPLQAALGVRQSIHTWNTVKNETWTKGDSLPTSLYRVYFQYQGLRPVLPEKTHPTLLDLMQRCWEANPAKRPTFSEITVELEELLRQVQVPQH
ncbi:hypothetical protein BHE74_00006713, partial [Ensete ventricosum]